MLKKALAAAALLSIAATSVSAYAAGATFGRGAPVASDANGGKKRTIVWVLIGGALVAVAVVAADGGGGDDDSASEE